MSRVRPKRTSESATSKLRRRQRIGRELDKILDIREVLNDDLAKAEDLFGATTRSFATRTFVRTMAAEFEGHLFVLERLMVILNENSDMFPLTTEEIMVLRQQSVSLSRTGDISSSERFFPFRSRLLFAMKLFANRTTFADAPDTSRHGWEAVGRFLEIRNRLMHPKRVDDLRITDSEVETINRAQDWLRDAFNGMFRRARLGAQRSRRKAGRNDRKRRAELTLAPDAPEKRRRAGEAVRSAEAGVRSMLDSSIGQQVNREQNFQ